MKHFYFEQCDIMLNESLEHEESKMKAIEECIKYCESRLDLSFRYSYMLERFEEMKTNELKKNIKEF